MTWTAADQRLVETMQAIVAEGERRHTETVAEYRAEVERLRANIEHVRLYAETLATWYETAADEGAYMAGYFRGKADAYAGIALKMCVAYGADYRTEVGASNDEN